MRGIRAKIADRHGIELTDQQVQELAARRLESILDLRTVKPALLDQLRRSAGARPDTVAAADRATPPYEFEDTTLYDSPSGFTRFIRKLLNPILKLFFNPNPLIRALHLQSCLNADAAKREAERDQRQAEWNALHFEILQRVVAEASRASLEVQSLALGVESLGAKVDFNERRVRGIEGVVHQPRPGGSREREREREAPSPAAPSPQPPPEAAPVAAREAVSEAAGSEAPRRRRRRRRGRRGGSSGEAATASAPSAPGAAEAVESDETDEGDSYALEPGEGPEAVESLESSAREEAVLEAPAAEVPASDVREPEVLAPAATIPEPDPDEPK